MGQPQYLETLRTSYLRMQCQILEEQIPQLRYCID